MANIFKEEESKDESFFDLLLNYDFNFEYTDFDQQKGGNSPKMLTRKRKYTEETDFKNENPSFKAIRETFDNYLDFVSNSYFKENKEEEQLNNSFKLTSLDKLLSPLRKSLPFGLTLSRKLDSQGDSSVSSSFVQIQQELLGYSQANRL